MAVFVCEYYDANIGDWIEYYRTTYCKEAKKWLKSYITGNPKKRLAWYDRFGVKKIKRK